ncbi:hypothetical protein Glo7428_2103 [Gloeocapsa sp. PCC 7428]|uniref:hypothetical protein n=1 Tax=Gloeocapsa sp. PCC 7428 TaxID=1173026 RepID=UPI0002A5FFBE|nr:hypothetical protein [Gloeocapsa sp. PCC 7428]AFZ30634.1 hypothetical protein Glo7428_2103 [Gloeocapsa sp. PCC 7428]
MQLEPTQPLPQAESIAPLEAVESVPPAQPVQVEPGPTKLTSQSPSKATPHESEPAIASSNDSTSSDAALPPRQHSLLQIFKDEHDRWLKVLDALCPECNNQQEKTSALLQWVEAQLGGATEASPATDAAIPEPEMVEAKSRASIATEEITQQNSMHQARSSAVADSAIVTVVVDQARTLSWLTGRIESLEAELATVKQQRKQAIATLEQSSQFQQEIEHLTAENRQFQQAAARFEAARAALLGSDRPTLNVASASFSTSKKLMR